MELRRIGRLDVSVVGLGCNNFGGRTDADGTRAVVDAAIDAGITYFDTAEVYNDGRSEELLGAALKGRRDDVIVATKWGHDSDLAEGERGGDPAVVRRRLEASLQRLGTDRVDHYQMHRPDPWTPVEETLGALAELQAEGKVVEIGATHLTADQLRHAHAVAGERSLPAWASLQNYSSLLTRDPETDGVYDACAELGVGFVPYFPLESGLLTGKYRLGSPMPEGSRLAGIPAERAGRFINDERLAVVERLIAWAAEHGHTLLDLAMSWHTSNPLVASVIAGATRPEQVAANVAAAGWALTETDRAEVVALLG
ncbi:aldo/keto reductase [Actinotalea sp. M2MS4P-6]|uniref:aldo/keto reductase n=1 Tax=Actinotalea sp. M2MS4P-6 TaxID=2983762 RepID=UPI0021E37228|nr:aldo/keto reductase [Actinotalea sp. M2MS4P-6]MCV2392926.1 aldo/keto reductase [Actinotalea sp. M2MS4P-6]